MNLKTLILKLTIIIAFSYLMLAQLLTNLGSPASNSFKIFEFFKNTTGVGLYLSGMYANRQTNTSDYRINFTSEDNQVLQRFTQRYRWMHTRDPLIITETRLFYYQNSGFNASIMKSGFVNYWCNQKINGSRIKNITFDYRPRELNEIIKSNGEYDNQTPWIVSWSENCRQ